MPFSNRKVILDANSFSLVSDSGEAHPKPLQSWLLCFIETTRYLSTSSSSGSKVSIRLKEARRNSYLLNNFFANAHLLGTRKLKEIQEQMGVTLC